MLDTTLAQFLQCLVSTALSSPSFHCIRPYLDVLFVPVQINDDITPGRDLRDGEKEFITSSLLLGALLAALISGNLADIIGRKWVIAIADMLFIVGAIMQAASTSIWHMMIPGRFVMGWGVGAAA